jgi:DNA-binding HxlR family transcriptional regulator
MTRQGAAMNFDNHTPTEKMIILALQLHDTMSIADLMALTGTKTRKYMMRTLRTLILCGLIEQTQGDDPTYRLVAQ